MADYTVWRTTIAASDGIHSQVHAIVAAKSRAAAARAMGISSHELKTYGSETGNAVEVAIAMAAVGVVFTSPTSGEQDYTAKNLSSEVAQRVHDAACHAQAVLEAKQTGKAVWKRSKWGGSASLSLGGGMAAMASYDVDGKYKASFNGMTAVKRYETRNDAMVAAVALTRQNLTRAISALPEFPLLEEDYE